MYKKIERFCKDRGITIAQFERLIGRKKGYIAKLESKDSNPGVRTAMRIAQVMGITVEELMRDDNG